MPDQTLQPAKETGVIDIPLAELSAVDISDRKVEQMARGFIMGSQAIGRRKEIREKLEDRVTKKIGVKGKYLTDKLFELIEGVYIVDKRGGQDGRTIKYYQTPPNLNAIIYALDRVLGKPKQYVDKSEEKKGIILVEHVIRNLANNPYARNRVSKNDRGSGSGAAGVDALAGNGGDDSAGVDEGAGEVAL